MSSNSETGHSKNVKNAFEYVQVVKGYGTEYGPGNSEISLAALTDKQSTCQKVYDAWVNADGVYTPVEQLRINKYAPLDKLVRGTMKEYASFDPDKLEKAGLKSIADKSTGNNVKRHSAEKKKKEKEAKAAGLPVPTEADYHSVAQLSYDMKLTNFNEFLVGLKNSTIYKPTTVKYKLAALQAVYDDLFAVNESVKAAYPAYSNSLLERNKEMYDEKTGLLHLIELSKNYVEGLYADNKPKAKLELRIKFRKLTK